MNAWKARAARSWSARSRAARSSRRFCRATSALKMRCRASADLPTRPTAARVAWMDSKRTSWSSRPRPLSSSRKPTSEGSRKRSAEPARPMRAVRPTRCTYSSASQGRSYWRIWVTPSRLRPRAATSVARSTPASALQKPRHTEVRSDWPMEPWSAKMADRGMAGAVCTAPSPGAFPPGASPASASARSSAARNSTCRPVLTKTSTLVCAVAACRSAARR
mmetsp:Transcript_24268/g.81638  ORF Transcript_24268/g.81638 Transcript_24268/m.81638 type:complete len:220 (+) Transcript_24268:373-1032(+)